MFCEQCVSALAYHPSGQVRMMLAEDEHTPVWALKVLAQDADAGVCALATHRLGEGASPVIETVFADLEGGW